jgi:hypothetical protein
VTTRVAHACVLALVIVGVIASWRAATLPLGAVPRGTGDRRNLQQAVSTDTMVPAFQAGAVAAFRRDRRPAPNRFDARRPPQPRQEDAAPLPRLVLAGLIWGDTPTALVEGLPGSEGARVVRSGDQVGGVTIRKVFRDHLVASGFDTTWTLRLRDVSQP